MNNILTKALLIKLSISQFNPKRQDAKTTREVLADKNAKTTAGNWIKNLISPVHLEAITAAAMSARVEHYNLSLPWQDDGWRILPAAMYARYQDTMKKHKGIFSGKVDEFTSNYPSYIQEAKAALNGMFDIKDYLSTSEIATKFGFKVDVSPLPAGEDFRIELSSDELETLREDVNERVKEATTAAIKDLWQRLALPLKNMVSKLSDKDAIFRNTLVENLVEIVEIIPDLNITGDIALSALAAECKKKLGNLVPDDLRNNKGMRKQAAIEAENILKKMEGYI